MYVFIQFIHTCINNKFKKMYYLLFHRPLQKLGQYIKASHVTSNKNPYSNHYETINSNKVKKII